MDQKSEMIAKKDIQKLSYEQALEELEHVITGLETGTLALEEMIAQFEVGKELLAHCQNLLDQAELRVRQVEEVNSVNNDDGEAA
ncbi:MAG TPA: exodeoxyribonuclease VII small subunit [Anaerolineaceae bacterium]|nr:exodeoxyribonuclease VII small subunit [Anaerolineaceae bacterium]